MKGESKIRVVADYGNLCGEGPLWDATEQSLYWTDITGKQFFRYRWLGQHERLHRDFEVAGFCLQKDGGFVVTNSQGIWLWDPVENRQLMLASEADGEECVLNDCIADPEGRVYSGSYHYDPSGESQPSFLFRVDIDGSVHVADEGIQFSNGLAFSPDCSILYFADTVARCIYSYDWRRRDGELKNRRVFARIPREQGVPDGLAVDAQGYLWCAHWFGGCLTRYDADGKLERRIKTPALQTSSLAFGGPDLNEIFITSAAKSDSLLLAPIGYEPDKLFVGGPLYQMTGDIQGKLDYRSGIRKPVAGP